MKYSLVFSSVLATTAQAIQYYPLLGPIFPAPTDLASSQAFQAATWNITETFESLIQDVKSSPNTSLLDNTDSFTVQIYSPSEITPLYQYYYTAPLTRNATTGVQTVDENTIFRIGSGSKLWTLLLFLAAVGDEPLSNPVTQYIPEFQTAATNTANNATRNADTVDFTKWEDITLRELASHLAGIDGFTDLAASDESELTLVGFPELPDSEVPSCGTTVPCNRTQFFEGITQTHPFAPTSFTPIYSNAAVQICSYALEAITNSTFDSLLSTYILDPLALNHSSVATPPDHLAVIPGDPTSSGWNLQAGDETPAGDLYSSTKDMTTVGRAILNNTLLSPALTQRWMRPLTHTDSIEASVGAPWEIFSFQESGRVIDLYTKSGDLGSYSSMTSLSPEHNIGFTILAAGNDTMEIVAIISDLISAQVIPALEQAAKDDATSVYTGDYELVDATTNSSITISTDGGPGLSVDTWVSNYTNMLEVVTSSSLADVTDPVIRLYPTSLRTETEIGFRAVFVSAVASPGIGPFTKSCETWPLVDHSIYGNVGLDEFLFTLDQATGKAMSISPRALRETLLLAKHR